MTKNEIMDYVTETPHNINKNILGQKLDQYANQSGGGNAVQYVEQMLTEEQQMTARKNLGLYYIGEHMTDIAPEQEITFSEGFAEMMLSDGMFAGGDRSYHGCAAVLVINGEEYEGTLEYFDIAMFYRGTFGPYHLTRSNTLELGEGASVQNGDTVMVRLYAFSVSPLPIDPKYLPANAASAVSYNNQNLDYWQAHTARKNIGAYATYYETLISEYQPSTNVFEADLIQGDEYSFFIVNAVIDDTLFSSFIWNCCDMVYKQWFEAVGGADGLEKHVGYIEHVVENHDRKIRLFVPVVDGKTWKWIRLEGVSVEQK